MPQEFADGQATDPGPAMMLSQGGRFLTGTGPLITKLFNFRSFPRSSVGTINIIAGMAGSYPRAQPGRMKTELTGASIVFGAGHARDELLDVPIVPQDFLPAWNIRECPYFLERME